MKETRNSSTAVLEHKNPGSHTCIASIKKQEATNLWHMSKIQVKQC